MVFTFIDGANLYNGVKSLGWFLDYARFRVWLKETINILWKECQELTLIFQKIASSSRA